MVAEISIKLSYFNIEAAAEKVRLALVMCGKEFEDHRVEFAEWGAMKGSTPYGQMPVMSLSFGGSQPPLLVAQSPAMLRYVAKKFDKTGTLLPSDSEEYLKVEEMCGLSDDMARSFAPALYLGMGRHTSMGHPEDWPQKDEVVKSLREKFLETELPKWMGFYTAKLQGQPFFCGPAPTIADLQILAQLRYFTKGVADHVPKDCLEKYPEIIAWMNRMYEVPQIKSWYKM